MVLPWLAGCIRGSPRVTNLKRVVSQAVGGSTARVSGQITANNSERITQQVGMDFLALEGDQAGGVLLLEGDQAPGLINRLLLEGDQQGGSLSSFYTQRVTGLG